MSERPNLLAGEDLPHEPRQKRSRARRERLEEAALALFGGRGYAGTSVGAITRQARLPVGSFYQHYRSKRQLLLAMMDDLLGKLSRLELRPAGVADVQSGLRAMLGQAFSLDLHYLGACRAWQEAAMTDCDLALKQEEIHEWTSGRVLKLFEALQKQRGARAGVDRESLARSMDSMFWSFLARAARISEAERARWIDSATHLIYHALFADSST